MDEIRAHERGRMYAALVKSYRDGWTPFEASALFCGYWPETYEAPDDSEIHQIYPDWLANDDTFADCKTVNHWFSGLRDWLENNFPNEKSPIVALFDELKSKDEVFLLDGLSKKAWTGWDAANYLSGCPSEVTENVDSRSPEDYLEGVQLERFFDYHSIWEELLPVMNCGVLSSYECEFYGHRATNKFNRSKDGMNLPHPVGCFRRFSREHLEPQGLKPIIFGIAEEIEAAGCGRMFESGASLDELMEYWRTMPPASVEGLSAPIEADDEYLAGALDAVEVAAEPKADPDSIEIVAGVTVGDMRALLDGRNEGKTFCPVLLAAVRAAKAANAFRAGVDEYGFKRSPTRLKGDIEAEARRQLEALRIYTGDRAAKTLEEKTKASDADIKAVVKCCRLERIQPN